MIRRLHTFSRAFRSIIRLLGLSRSLIRESVLIFLFSLILVPISNLKAQDNGQSLLPTPVLEDSYKKFKATGNIEFIRRIMVAHIHHPQLKEVMKFFQAKKEYRIDQTIFLILESFSKYNIIIEVYFSTPQNKDYYFGYPMPEYRKIFYKSFLFNFQYAELTKEILEQIGKDSKKSINKLSIEVQFLELMTQKKINRNAIFKVIDQFVFPAGSAKSYNLDRTRKIVKGILLFSLKDYSNTYQFHQDILNKESKKQKNNAQTVKSGTHTDKLINTDADTNANAKAKAVTPPPKPIYSFPHLEFQFQNKQKQFLGWLYQNGYYRLVVSYFNQLQEAYPTNKNIFPINLVKKSAYLSRVKTRFETTEQITAENIFSWSHKRNLLYENKFDELINYHLRSDGEHYFHYLLALAASKRWVEYSRLVNHLQIDQRKNYLWIKNLFTDPDEARELLKSSESKDLTQWQIDYLNFADEFPDQIPQVTKVFQQLITLDKNLKDEMIKNKEQIPVGLFEYTISKISQNYFLNGDYEKCADLFENFYHQFNFSHYKEKLMLYHGLSKIVVDPKEGKKILYKLLYLNPKTVYRFEIEESFELLL